MDNFKEYFFEAFNFKKEKPSEVPEVPEVKQLSVEEIKAQQTINQTQRLVQFVEMGTIYRKWNELTDVEKNVHC